jgi:hypothetical protein
VPPCRPPPDRRRGGRRSRRRRARLTQERVSLPIVVAEDPRACSRVGPMRSARTSRQIRARGTRRGKSSRTVAQVAQPVCGQHGLATRAARGRCSRSRGRDGRSLSKRTGPHHVEGFPGRKRLQYNSCVPGVTRHSRRLRRVPPQGEGVLSSLAGGQRSGGAAQARERVLDALGIP